MRTAQALSARPAKYYFASDFHLGINGLESSSAREKRIVSWLKTAGKDATEIFILGDVFDFWFEYRRAVPKGYVRLLGALAEITDSGIPVHWFSGNHDMWIFDYLPSEVGVTIHHKPIDRVLCGYTLHIGHGDGLGPGDHGYKLLKRVFRSAWSQWLFARLHPNTGIWLANKLSGSSRNSSAERDKTFLGADKEWLAQYAEELSRNGPYDYFVFGHRHLPMRIALQAGGEYINLGDWISHYTYGVLTAGGFELKVLDDFTTLVYSNSGANL